ncbi:MAG: serine acetyltransferase [Deltaproteobacteria bacterium]|nr:MAG: serine acetyltransferase [Deltaproteobacteria bacterium]
MNPAIASDLYRYAGKADFRALVTHLIFTPGFKFIYVFRKANGHRRGSLRWLFYRLLHRRYIHKYGFQIPLSTRIGKGLHITHFGGVVVHGEVVFGDNCDIAHGVTVGQANRGSRKGCPTIGNKVWIGTGAVLVGKITVGDNVLIAPNAFVNFDVPSNSIVLGNPARVIPREDATAGYIDRVLE